MHFVNYTKAGQVTIPAAALALSNMDKQEKLAMFTFDGAILLLKNEAALENLCEHLANRIGDEDTEDNYEEEIGITIPAEILEDADLDCEDLQVLTDDGIVMIVCDRNAVSLSPWTVEELFKCGVTPTQLAELLLQAGKSGDADD